MFTYLIKCKTAHAKSIYLLDNVVYLKFGTIFMELS
jgi:hypothetical protein